MPDDIVDGICAQFGADREVGMGKAVGFMRMGYMMAQSFGSVVSTDQLQGVLDDGAERLSEHGKSWIEQMQELTNTLKQEMVEVQSEGNSKLAESLEGTVTLLDSAIKEIGNPKNTDSLPFVVAELVEQKVAAALVSATKAQDEANEEQKEALEDKLRTLEAQHASLVQAIRCERESLREALGLKSMLEESHESSHIKGADFEGDISEQLVTLTGNFGDELEDIGELTDGVGSSKIGDHLVTVRNGKNSNGKIVFEDKSGTFTVGGTAGIVAQLKTAMTSYGATAAIGVVNAKKAPARLRKSGYQRMQSNIHLVCVDWDNDDYSGLEMLYPIVRELVIIEHHSNAGDSSSVDREAIITLCNECLTRLKDINKLKLNLRNITAKTALNVASELEVMQSELKDTFTRLIRLHRGGSSE